MGFFASRIDTKKLYDDGWVCLQVELTTKKLSDDGWFCLHVELTRKTLPDGRWFCFLEELTKKVFLGQMVLLASRINKKSFLVADSFVGKLN